MYLEASDTSSPERRTGGRGLYSLPTTAWPTGPTRCQKRYADGLVASTGMKVITYQLPSSPRAPPCSTDVAILSPLHLSDPMDFTSSVTYISDPSCTNT